MFLRYDGTSEAPSCGLHRGKRTQQQISKKRAEIVGKMEDFATNNCDIDEIKYYFLFRNGDCDFNIDRYSLLIHKPYALRKD